MLQEQDPLQYLKLKLSADYRMNRSNGLRTYESILAIDLCELAYAAISRKGKFIWYDMCCGTFEVANYFIKKMIRIYGPDISSLITATGVDLDPVNAINPCLPPPGIIKYGNVADYPLDSGTDLVTCLKGLKYVDEHLGQVPQTVENWYNNVSVGALLAFDTNFVTCKVEGVSFVDYLQKRLGDSISVKTTYDIRDLTPCPFPQTVVQIKKQSPEPLQITLGR